MIPKLYDRELLDDLGLWRGWAVFEAMEARNNVIFHFQDHFKRLTRSCELSEIPLPDFLFADTLRMQLESSIAFHGFYESLVKVAISRGKSENHKDPNGESSLIVRILPLLKPKDEPLKLVVKKALKSNFPEIKSTGPYHDAMLLRSMAQKEGFDDFLYFHESTGITESGTANLFFVYDFHGDKVLATPRDKILLGITRSVVLLLAKNSNIFYTVLEIPSPLFTKNFLKEAKECFLTSTTIGIKEVASITDCEGGLHNFKTGENTLTSVLKQKFLLYREEYFKKHPR